MSRSKLTSLSRWTTILITAALFSSAASSDEGPMIYVTSDMADISVTANGATRVLTTVSKNTRLWTFDANEHYYRVMDPKTQQRGWLRKTDAEVTEGPTVAYEAYQAAEGRLNEAAKLAAAGEYSAAEPLFLDFQQTAEAFFGDDHPSTALGHYFLGDFYEASGMTDDATKSFRQSLRIYQASVGRMHVDSANLSERLGVLHHNLGQYEAAFPFYQQCLDVRIALLGENHVDTARAYCNFGAAQSANGNYPKAAALLRKAVQLRKAVLGHLHVDTADATYELAVVLHNAEQYSEAQEVYEEVLAAQHRLQGDSSADIALTLQSWGNVKTIVEDYDGAVQLLQKAVNVRKQVEGDDCVAAIDILNDLGTALEYAGQTTTQHETYQEALRISRLHHGSESQQTALMMSHLAWAEYLLANYRQAETLQKQALEMQRRLLGEEHADTARSASNLGLIYVETEKFTEAEQLLKQNLETNVQLFGPSAPETAIARNNLALLYETLGSHDRAIDLYEAGLTVLKEAHGERHLDVVLLMSNIANLYQAMEDYEKSKPLLERCLELRLELQGSNHRDVGAAQSSLAAFYLETQQYPQALALHEESLATYKRSDGASELDKAFALSMIGYTYHRIGDFATADSYFDQYLPTMRRLLGDQHTQIATELADRSRLNLRRGNHAQAIILQDEAQQIFRRHLSRVLPGLTEKARQKYLASSFRDQFANAASTALQSGNDARTATISAAWVLNAKAAAEEAIAEAALLSTAEATPLVQELRSVRNQISRLSLKVGSQVSKEARIELASLESQQQQLNQEIATLGLGLTKLDPWISTGALIGKLPYDSVFINIARFRGRDFSSFVTEEMWLAPRYAAWVIPAVGGGPVQIVDLGEAAPIDQLVENVRRELAGSFAKLTEDSEESVEEQLQPELAALSQAVFAPVEKLIGDAKQLIVSPDGNLWTVPWESLLTSDGRYVIEAYDTRYLLSGRELVYSVSQRSLISPPTIFADPDFDLDVDRVVAASTDNQHRLRSALDRKFARLTASASEAALIAPAMQRHFGIEPIVLTGAAAQEANFKQLHRPRTLLLSTHGYFEPLKAVASQQPNETRSPLLRCGLAFAGVNQRQRDADVDTEDGILTGLEIVGTDLRGTELVVLSACQTGLGDIQNGEGVVGLRQAFQLAGAQSVVSSLWEVEDGATAKLMVAFFHNMANGMNRSAALRAAKLSMIEARRNRFGAAHPFYWAAFTLTGDGGL